MSSQLSRPLDILVVSGIFPPDIGGPAGYVPRIGASLCARGHRVTVICLSDSLAHDDSAYPFAVHRIARGMPKLLRYFKVVAAICRYARYCDVIYVNTMAGESVFAAKLMSKPTVMKIVGDHAWERARNWKWFTRSIDDYQTAHKSFRLICLDLIRTIPSRRADKIIVPSNYLRRMVLGWGCRPESTVTVYNAMERPDPIEVSRKTMTVATVCRLVSWKGLDALIRVISTIPAATLEIVGDGPLLGELRALASELGIADRVIFLGTLPPRDVHSVLARATVFVLNSSYEGLPHVILEAMSLGLPVVATGVGGTVEVVIDGETGLLVPFGDEAALRAAILHLLTDPEYSNSLTVGARALLDAQFTYQHMVEATESILREVARRGPNH